VRRDALGAPGAVTRAAEARAGKLVLQHSVREGCHMLTLLGELDHATAPELEAAIVRLCNDGAKEIVLDLRELSRIDSTGWRVIYTGEKLCDGHECDFSIARVHAPPRRLTKPTDVRRQLSFRRRGMAKSPT